jgi:hypothetical protein
MSTPFPTLPVQNSNWVVVGALNGTMIPITANNVIVVQTSSAVVTGPEPPWHSSPLHSGVFTETITGNTIPVMASEQLITGSTEALHVYIDESLH